MRRRPAVKAVFFDAGGTLFRPHPSVGELYSRHARRHGCAVSARWAEARFRAEWKRRNGLAGLRTDSDKVERAWWAELVRAVFGRRVPPERFPAFFHELYDAFGAPRTWKLFPESVPVLETLRRRGYRLGVVSNWDSRLFGLCDGLGVTRRVDFVLASAAVGASKPHGRIFRRALRLAGVRPSEALHVGDHRKEDFHGARRAGLRAVFLDRSVRVGDGDTIPSLTDLLARLPPQPAGGARK
jgi:putative hydrolase of the HAD superfamily